MAPQGFVRYRGREGRFDDVAGWGFQLIGWRYDPAEHLTESQREFFSHIGGVVVGIAEQARDGLAADIGGAYESFFRRHGIHTMLMRPDFTIFGIASLPKEVSLLLDDLRDQLKAIAPNLYGS